MAEKTDLLEKRRAKALELRESGVEIFRNDFRVTATTADIRSCCADGEELPGEGEGRAYAVAGRVRSIRRMGKAGFLHLADRTGAIQVYARLDALGEEAFSLYKRLDVGDFAGVEGPLFRTRAGELTIRADRLVLLTKSLRPLPEKWHGLRDVETRYRQRYLDLIMNPRVREIFEKRTRIIRLIRDFLDARRFIEVETPMMQALAGGAAARPFRTHHNALDMDLYLRIAPELYLKRLLVGGLERVYEIIRNFRNEGVSTEHNPEFTMLEFYHAYATYEDLMDLTEEMVSSLAHEVCGGTEIQYQGQTVRLDAPWDRLTMCESLARHGGLPDSEVEDAGALRSRAEELGIAGAGEMGRGRLQAELFDALVEPKLVQPTFITQYPVEVSPLARQNRVDPEYTDRFELFVAGREIANAFSELNDPMEQRERFERQIADERRQGEVLAALDEDFIRALEHGMPPAAGEGIGVDRLVMLLTDAASIREVILFPLLRPERGEPRSECEGREE